MFILKTLLVCLMACALFGLSFGQENDFREFPEGDFTESFEKRDLPLNTETVKPCLDSVRFAPLQTISRSYRGPQSITAADFNKDGRQDLAVAFSTDNRAVWYKNDGDNNWSAFVLGTVNGASSVFAADINSDGWVDVVASSPTANEVYWFKNTGTSWTKYTVGSATNPQSLFVADVNGDNKLDIIVAGDEMRWFENNINNGAPSAFTSTPITYSSAVDSVFAADINGDGYVDLVVASSAADEVAWLPNTGGSGGGGVFDSATLIAKPTGPVQVFCNDMNNDSLVDVISVNKGDNSTILYYNNVTVSLNNSAPAEAGWLGVYVDAAQDAPESVFVADINGDGDQDIIVAITGADLVNWYNTTSDDYTWTGHKAGNLTGPTFVFARDIDGDDAKDIVVASADTSRVAWIEEMCITSYPDDSSDSHVVGWATATGVIGGLLVLWILIAIAIAIRDFVKGQLRKESEKRKKEAKALAPDMHDNL